MPTEPVSSPTIQNGGFNDSYTANNQLFGYAYDAAGNLLSDGLFNQMTWDAENRISTVAGATYLYDAAGNRVEKQGVGVTDTVYFGGRPIARLAAGQWTDLIYGPTGLLAEVPGTQTGAPVYRVTDHLGTTVGNLLADGTFVNPTDYTPFGQVFNGGTNDPYLFTGKERDAETGLDFFGARYYASSMGRWMSPDWSAKEEAVPYAKLDNPQSLNLYSYVHNNPLSNVDIDGHSPDWWQKLRNKVEGHGWYTDADLRVDATQRADGTWHADQSITVSEAPYCCTPAEQAQIQQLNQNVSMMMIIQAGGAGSSIDQELVSVETSVASEAESAAAKTYESGLADAQKAYPNKAGNIEDHHIDPKYLGGPANGPTVPIDAAYHQKITNAFRDEHPYGSGTVSAERLQEIKDKVYSQYPLPK